MSSASAGRGADRAVAARRPEDLRVLGGHAKLAAQILSASASMMAASGSSARSRFSSLGEVAPAEAFTTRARPFPLGEAGACRGGLIAAAGIGGRRGHQRSVTAPVAAPIAAPVRTSGTRCLPVITCDAAAAAAVMTAGAAKPGFSRATPVAKPAAAAASADGTVVSLAGRVPRSPGGVRHA